MGGIYCTTCVNLVKYNSAMGKVLVEGWESTSHEVASSTPGKDKKIN